MKTVSKALLLPVRLVLSVIFPKRCICCGEIIEENEEVCDICRRELAALRVEDCCLTCGRPKKYCQCKSRVFYFEKCVSSFENRDCARSGYYRYKLSGRKQYGTFFAQAMAISVKNAYRDTAFDAICAVPTSAGSRHRRGFDHLEVLARELSDILGIPLDSGLLACKSFKKPQHLSSHEERINNVREKYYITGRADGKTILLIDDIRTTGSTLNECAHMLLLAGAQSVYCAAALTAVPNKNSNTENNTDGDKNGNRNRN